MRTASIKIAFAALAALGLAACDREVVRDNDDEAVAETMPEPRSEPVIVEEKQRAATPRERQTVDLKGPAPVVRILPETTGVEACDDYLDTYVACHLTLGALEPTTLEDRYQKLRMSLLEESVDPTAADALRQRCVTLSDTMKDALDGRGCDEGPTPVADQDD